MALVMNSTLDTGVRTFMLETLLKQKEFEFELKQKDLEKKIIQQDLELEKQILQGYLQGNATELRSILNLN